MIMCTFGFIWMKKAEKKRSRTRRWKKVNNVDCKPGVTYTTMRGAAKQRLAIAMHRTVFVIGHWKHIAWNNHCYTLYIHATVSFFTYASNSSLMNVVHSRASSQSGSQYTHYAPGWQLDRPKSKPALTTCSPQVRLVCGAAAVLEYFDKGWW